MPYKYCVEYFGANNQVLTDIFHAEYLHQADGLLLFRGWHKEDLIDVAAYQIRRVIKVQAVEEKHNTQEENE